MPLTSPSCAQTGSLERMLGLSLYNLGTLFCFGFLLMLMGFRVGSPSGPSPSFTSGKKICPYLPKKQKKRTNLFIVLYYVIHYDFMYLTRLKFMIMTVFYFIFLLKGSLFWDVTI